MIEKKDFSHTHKIFSYDIEHGIIIFGCEYYRDKIRVRWLCQPIRKVVCGLCCGVVWFSPTFKSPHDGVEYGRVTTLQVYALSHTRFHVLPSSLVVYRFAIVTCYAKLYHFITPTHSSLYIFYRFMLF